MSTKGHRLPQSVTIRVRCGGSLHAIRVDRRGRIKSLHGCCSGWSARQATLEGPRAIEIQRWRCAQVIGAWIVGTTDLLQDIPAELREARRILGASRTVSTVPVDARIGGISTRLLARIDQRTIETVRQVLPTTSYRRSQSNWVGGNHTDTIEIGSPGTGGKSERVWNAGRKWSGTNSIFRIAILRYWILRVYARGCAVVQGLITLDATEIRPDILKARWITQARGFDLRVEAGYLIRNPESGAWKHSKRRPAGIGERSYARV